MVKRRTYEKEPDQKRAEANENRRKAEEGRLQKEAVESDKSESSSVSSDDEHSEERPCPCYKCFLEWWKTVDAWVSCLLICGARFRQTKRIYFKWSEYILDSYTESDFKKNSEANTTKDKYPPPSTCVLDSDAEEENEIEVSGANNKVSSVPDS